MSKKRKVIKKVQSKKVIRSQELVIKVQPISPTLQDLGPEKDGGKYMIPKTWMSEKQVIKLVQKTPEKYVYKRPAKGGGEWSYVTGHYVERVLNFTFGWTWDFEVSSHGREGDMVWVLGKLTVKDDHGHTIIKSQFGRADIKFKKNSKEMLDFGNDLKSATTDAMKKCASLLGIASDIYGKSEYKQEAGKDIQEHPFVSSEEVKSDMASQLPIKKEGMVEGPDGHPTYVCSKCGDPINEQTADFSKKVHGNRLCRDCQPKKK